MTRERGSTPSSLASKPAAGTDPQRITLSHQLNQSYQWIFSVSPGIAGYGPGNSHAIAKRFGAEGDTIALVDRNLDRLRGGADRLVHDGVTAHAYVGDAGNPASIRSTLQAIRSDHGPISLIALVAHRGSDVSDVRSAQPEQTGQAFQIGVTGLAHHRADVPPRPETTQRAYHREITRFLEATSPVEGITVAALQSYAATLTPLSVASQVQT